jgi:hypothetical protein
MTAIVIGALAGPAYAQVPGSNNSNGARPSITLGGEQKSKTEDELKEEKARDEAYKAGVAKIPEQKAKSDPWGNLRSAATPAKPTQPRTAPK